MADYVEAVLGADNLYEILQIGRDADVAEVRKNYLRVSVKVHPDRNSSPGATEAFQRVAEARETLSDARLRREYDDATFGCARREASSDDDAGARRRATARPVAFSFEDALRVFQRAVRAAEEAMRRPGSDAGKSADADEGVGLADCVRVAQALLGVAASTTAAAHAAASKAQSRDGAAASDDAVTDAMAGASITLGTAIAVATTAAALLPADWKERLMKPENAARAASAAAVFAAFVGGAAALHETVKNDRADAARKQRSKDAAF